MPSKNIGTYDIGVIADVTHFVAVPSAGPSVDVDPILIPKSAISVDVKGYQYFVPTVLSISGSGFNCKGSFFTSPEEWKIDKLYLHHQAAVGDIIGLRVVTFNGDTVDGVLLVQDNVSTGTGSAISTSVEITPITVPANKRIGLIGLTQGKAAGFASAIGNGSLSAAGIPMTEFGYCYLSDTEVNVGDVFTFSAGTSPYVVGARLY